MRKYHINDTTLNIDKVTNSGWFDSFTYKEENNEITLLGKVLDQRNTGCSMASNRKLNAEMTVMYLPKYIFKRNNAFDVKNFPEIEKSLKDWVRFGRNCGIPVTYLGYVTGNTRVFDLLEDNFTMSKDVKQTIGSYSYPANSFVVYWKQSDLVNSKHGLATLSFIRYFYSNLSSDVYRRSIMLFNAIPEWNELKCLMMAHYSCHSSYTGYYGLMWKDMFKPLDNLYTLYTNMTNQNKRGAVNTQWTLRITNLLDKSKAFASTNSPKDITKEYIEFLYEAFSFIPSVKDRIKVENCPSVGLANNVLYDCIRHYFYSRPVNEESISKMKKIDLLLNSY